MNWEGRSYTHQRIIRCKLKDVIGGSWVGNTWGRLIWRGGIIALQLQTKFTCKQLTLTVLGMVFGYPLYSTSSSLSADHIKGGAPYLWLWITWSPQYLHFCSVLKTYKALWWPLKLISIGVNRRRGFKMKIRLSEFEVPCTVFFNIRCIVSAKMLERVIRTSVGLTYVRRTVRNSLKPGMHKTSSLFILARFTTQSYRTRQRRIVGWLVKGTAIKRMRPDRGSNSGSAWKEWGRPWKTSEKKGCHGRDTNRVPSENIYSALPLRWPTRYIASNKIGITSQFKGCFFQIILR